MSVRRIGLRNIPYKFIFPAAVALLAMQSMAAQDLSQAQDHSNLGLSLARAGKLPEAEQELRKAVQAAPAVAIPHAQLGSILGLEGKWKESLESFQKALDLDPANINFRRETAAVQWQLRQMTAAGENLRYVLTKHPDDSGAILLLGLVSEANGDYVTATRLLESQFQSVISQPDRTVALLHSELQSGQRANLPKIVSALRTKTNDPAWQDAIGRSTQIAAGAGDLETSESLFPLIASNHLSRSAAGFELARLRFNRGQVQAAQQLLVQFAGSGGGSANIQALLGHCYESLHQPELAFQAYQRAIDLEPSQVERYEDPIVLQLELGRTSDATSLLSRLITTAPADAKAWVVKGNVEVRSNAFQDALKSYTHASDLDRNNADALLGAAGIHAVSGSSEAAMADYKAGVQRFPNDSRFYIAFAAALLASPDAPQEYSKVKDLLLQALQLDPHSPDGHYQLGQLALRQGQLNAAKEEFLASLEADPNRSNAHFALSLVHRRMGEADDAAKHFAIYEKLKKSEERDTSMPEVKP